MTAKKIRSETGASITFALLLFLVCAALSAVILVAATTAAGRMRNLAETDQRYYSVTSAAELIKDLMDEEAVSVVEVENKNLFTIPKHMNEITDSDLSIVPPSDTDEYDTADGDLPPAENPDNTDDTAAKPVSALKTAIAEHCLVKEGYRAKIELTSAAFDSLNVTVDEILDTSGNLTFIIYNTEGKPYKLMLTFSSELDFSSRPPVTKVDNKLVTDAKEVSWHLTSMVTAYDNTIIDSQGAQNNQNNQGDQDNQDDNTNDNP